MKTSAAYVLRQITPERLMVVWFVVLMGLLIQKRVLSEPTYELLIVAHSRGWGYTILHQGKPLIDQPTIPGADGPNGFRTEAQARRVGEYVIQKLTIQSGLPTLTPEELNKLGVSTR